jgi:hypothetical protein
MQNSEKGVKFSNKIKITETLSLQKYDISEKVLSNIIFIITKVIKSMIY